MQNPILVEVTRGSLVESVHRGAVAVSDARGRLAVSLGDVERPIYPRSALKPLQALVLMESGAAERFGVSEEELALACASHSGEPMHTEPVQAWLDRIGCHVSNLACGPQRPGYEPTATAMIREGTRWTELHNNCSGKHTGFLSAALAMDVPAAGYQHHDHPVQQRVEAILKEMAGLTGDLPWGVDGCTVPNFAVPLSALARAFAQFADVSRIETGRASACTKLIASMIRHPELVAGTGRTCTALMRQGGNLAVKTGAEGVYIAILPEQGLAAAIKIDDGAGRASETAIAALLIALGALPDAGAAAGLAHAPVLNTRGVTVGERRATSCLTGIRIS